MRGPRVHSMSQHLIDHAKHVSLHDEACGEKDQRAHAAKNYHPPGGKGRLLELLSWCWGSAWAWRAFLLADDAAVAP